MHELGGLIKIPGHPIIDMDLTVKSFLDKVNAKSITNTRFLQKVANCTKEDFIRDHIFRHSYWPDVDIDEFAPEGLKFAKLNNFDMKSHTVTFKFGEITTDNYVYITQGDTEI